MKRFLMTGAFLTISVFAAGSAFADDAEICTKVTSMAEAENKAAPAKLDDVTTDTGAVFDCGAKTYESTFELSLATAGLPSGWQDRLQMAWNKGLCADADVHAAITAGWSAKAKYKFQDGVEYATVAKCE